MYYYLVQGYLVSATDALPPGGPVWGPAVLWPYNRLASVLPCGPKRDARAVPFASYVERVRQAVRAAGRWLSAVSEGCSGIEVSRAPSNNHKPRPVSLCAPAGCFLSETEPQ